MFTIAEIRTFITLLEIHKLMYFLQVAGEPLRLEYRKAPYGPYAENLRHVLRKVEGHLVSGYADGGDAPDKQLTLVPGAIEEARKFIAAHAATHARFDRVTALVEGFETPFGLELLATVHWVAANESGGTSELTSGDGTVRKGAIDGIVQRVYAWGERKRRFNREQIELAADRLAASGWFGNAPDLRPGTQPTT